jgi:hypothetical protein
MICSKCGASVPEGRKFCIKCGAAFSSKAEPPETTQRNANCAKCGAPILPGRAFCGSCGNRVIPDIGVGTSSESLERAGPVLSSQQRLDDATEIGEITDTTTAPVLNSARDQRTTRETNDVFAVPDRSEDVENRPRVPVWACVSLAVAILACVGGWFILHLPKQQMPSQVAQQSVSTTASTPRAASTSSAPVPATTPAGLTSTSLANMNYQVSDALSELGERTSIVKLVDGKGSFGDWNAFLDKEHISFGDLNGDGIKDAAVVLTFEGPGSAAPQVLVAVTNVNGKGESAAVKALGDNSVVKSINISGGVITVNMLTVGPNDSMANPETPQVLKLKVKGSKFLPADGHMAAAGDAEFTAPQIASHDIQIAPGAGFAFYPTFGGNWRITVPGGGFHATFDAPQDGKYDLAVTHLTSAAPACPGNGFSPVTIALDSQDIVENFDPAQSHNGSHDFVTDHWILNLHEGQNLMTWTAGKLCTNYWIQRIEIQKNMPDNGNGG